MNTSTSLARFRHWPATVGLLAIACLLSGTALAQRSGNLQSQMAILRSQVATLQAMVATLQSQVASGTIPNVGGYVTMDLSKPDRPTLRVAGANLQVVNGLGGTRTVNGLGNVIVGYDEASGLSVESLPAVCSLGYFTTQSACTAAGETWAVEHKEGSHNIVVGPYHRYSRYGGFIAGIANTINADSASVSGGDSNTASGNDSSVSGGRTNTASGLAASVSGGLINNASNVDASVSGGYLNTASGPEASVSGGYLNTASIFYASVSGGSSNTASGNEASVSGGYLNTASGDLSSVSGGKNNTASGVESAVSGGLNHNSTDTYDWRAGTLFEDQ